jgi:hypothetical protein
LEVDVTSPPGSGHNLDQEVIMHEKVSRDPSSTTRSLLAAGLLLLGLCTAGCNDDNNGPTTPLSTPTRTPTPPIGLNGVWVGTVRYTSRVLVLCEVEESSASVNITQEGSSITGRLSADCWRGGTFRATLTGEALSGSATFDDYCPPRTLSGTSSGGTILLTVSHYPGEICHPGGSAEFHR